MNETTPQCVGIIMDGNRRWAIGRGLSTLEGHKQGRDTLKNVVRWARDAGVQYLVFYAFSTENWKRTEKEVSYLLKLFKESLENELEDIKQEGAKIRFIGKLDLFPEELQALMKKTEEETKDNHEGTVALAVSYGGRAEIIDAVNTLQSSEKKSITEDELREALWSNDIPDPDIIVRTGGEKRLSNFLTWQSVYSEFFFIDTLWPDFSEKEFKGILDEFAQRKRNFGK